LFWHYPHYYSTTTPVSAIRQGPWKLLQYYEEGPRKAGTRNHIELYNLAEDIGEKNNLAGQVPKKAAELQKLLRAWRENVGAQHPKPNPNYRPSTKKGG